jgi:hypothetical protein
MTASRTNPGPMLSVETEQDESSLAADIKILAQGDRRDLEALYLQLREVAQQNGLKIEYQLSLSKPTAQSES